MVSLLNLVILFVNLFKCLTSLQLSMVGVQPSTMIVGQNAKLQCLFDLEGEELYSLKWYKNGKEFYRYMPGQERMTDIYTQPGILIDLQYSDIYQLHMLSVSLDTAGVYRCEVVTEAPHFNTIHDTVKVDVISLPKGPEISGLKTTYSAGDLVRANCSAYGSLPPVSLMWYINKEMVPTVTRYNRTLSSHYPLSTNPASALRTTETNKLTSSHLELFFTLKLSHFENGTLKLKCTAFLGDIFMRSEDVSVEQTRPKGSNPNVRDIYSNNENLSGLFHQEHLNKASKSDAVKLPMENTILDGFGASGGSDWPLSSFWSLWVVLLPIIFSSSQ